MFVGVLGPLEVEVAGRAVTVAGGRLRALLVRLAVEPGRPVSIGELAAALWGHADLPGDPANALQSLVSRLRRTLGPPAVVSQQPGGYQLELAADRLDANRFIDLAKAGRALLLAGDTRGAAGPLEEALDLWRGPALVDAGDADYVDAYLARWEALRQGATCDLIDLALLEGRAADVVSQLEELVAAHPLREGHTVRLMTALAASGRSAEALAVYEQTRRFLASELGTDPGSELKQLHLALLRGDVELSVAPPPAPRGRSNLRSPLTSFVARTEELSLLSGLLTQGRLTTLVGPGGAGKTRLAVEAARRWVAETSHSAWLVELAPVTSEDHIAPKLLGALGIRENRLLDRGERIQQSDEDRLFDALAESHCLLVIDNCEHLIEPVARLVDEILGRAPGVRILATSREPLAITGEALCPLPPLSQPAVDSSLDVAALTPAVRLWVDRAKAASPGFVLGEDNVAVVTEIVRRLDGLPLAIELAAARLRVLPLEEIASRLSDRFRLLTGGNRTSLPRHRTLRAVVEWSWDLLTPEERLLAERLAVFPAGASVASASAVCGDERLAARAIPELLSLLVDKSLLQPTDRVPIRYRMLETIREYGVERLTERGEIHQVRTAHADHFASLATALEPRLHDSRQLDALEELNIERDNVLAALRHYGDAGRPADALTLGLALVWYWSLRGSNSECVAWMDFVIAANEGADNPSLVYAQAAWAIATASSSDVAGGWGELQTLCARLLEQLIEAPEPPFPSLKALGPIVAVFSGQPERAAEVVAAVEQSPDRWVRAAVHAWAANLGENDGDLEQIRRETALAFGEFTALGDRWGLSMVLTARAYLSTLEGDLEAAVADYTTALRYVTELGSTEDDLFLRLRLAELEVRRGDTSAARLHLQRLRSAREGGLTAERQLFADWVMVAVLVQEQKPAEAAALTADLRHRVTVVGPPSAMQGHALSMILASSAVVAAETGSLEVALADATAAHPTAVATRDMPILAHVGVALACVAGALGQPALAAEMLGAAAQVRGGEDLSDPRISDLARRLRQSLGDAYDKAYLVGRRGSREEAVAGLDPARLPR